MHQHTHPIPSRAPCLSPHSGLGFPPASPPRTSGVPRDTQLGLVAGREGVRARRRAWHSSALRASWTVSSYFPRVPASSARAGRKKVLVQITAWGGRERERRKAVDSASEKGGSMGDDARHHLLPGGAKGWTLSGCVAWEKSHEGCGE
jgi:hypothetical protein